ncbi:unnamed protein product, partial [Prorocentrum cordatum]
DAPSSGFAFSAEDPGGASRPSSFAATDELPGSGAPDLSTAVDWVDTLEPDLGHAAAGEAYAEEHLGPTRRAGAGAGGGGPAPWGGWPDAGGEAPRAAEAWEPDDDDDDDVDLMEDARPHRSFVGEPRELGPPARGGGRAGAQGGPRRRQLSGDEERLQSLLDRGGSAGF